MKQLNFNQPNLTTTWKKIEHFWQMKIFLLSVASFFVTSSATQPGATTGWVTYTIYDPKDLSCQGQPIKFLAKALGFCNLYTTYNGNYSLTSGNLTLSQFPKFQVVGNLFVKTYGREDSTCSGSILLNFFI